MRLLKPRVLRPGDTLMTVTQSWGGPATYPQRYEAGKRQLEQEFGVHVREASHALRDAAWIARNPQARADDLMDAFADPSVAGIVSTIGGDDALRLMRFVDLDRIRSHPKVFLGFSDANVVNMMCLQAGLVSFCGVCIMVGCAENAGMHRYTAESVRRTLFSTEPVGRLSSSGGWTDEFLDWADPANQDRARALHPPMPWRVVQGQGTVRGPLLGGCLEVWQWLRGTSLWPDPSAFDGAMLFLETSELGLPPGAVAQELRIYAAMGLLDRVGAVLFGRPAGRIPVARFDAYDEAIRRVVRDEQGLGTPIVTRMDFGHTAPNFVVPYGITAEVDCESGALTITEAAVTD